MCSISRSSATSTVSLTPSIKWLRMSSKSSGKWFLKQTKVWWLLNNSMGPIPSQMIFLLTWLKVFRRTGLLTWQEPPSRVQTRPWCTLVLKPLTICLCFLKLPILIMATKIQSRFSSKFQFFLWNHSSKRQSLIFWQGKTTNEFVKIYFLIIKY